MKTTATDMFGIDLPIFGFSHCRDVVAAVSRAGGMGVLGGSGFSAEHLEEELRWLDEHTDGRPYGIDLLMASKYDKGLQAQKLDIDAILPAAHVAFLREAMDAAGIARLPDDNGREMVIERMHHNLALAQQAIARSVDAVPALPHETAGVMRHAVMTVRERIPDAARERLALIAGDYL